MKKIQLTQGYSVFLDDEDYNRLKQYTWMLDKHTVNLQYAYRQAGRKTIRMHREILDAPLGVEVDHINGNGLDNRRVNLRLASRAENSRNTRKFRRGKYKGVTYQARLNKAPWQSRICVNLHQRHLGYFKTEVEAAKAYDKAARRYYGLFARLNFSEDLWDIGEAFNPKPVGRRRV